MKSRVFERRKKQITLIEQEDWVAVYDPDLEVSVPRWLSQTTDGKAFQQVGWRFVPRATNERSLNKPTAQIFIRNERLLLAPGSVVIKFTDQTERATIDSLLSKFRLHIVGTLTFADNLFVVVPTEPRDVLELVSLLSGLGTCEFAEPEFIEGISARPLHREGETHNHH